jgi:PAS domain S-box-containing protein
VPSRTSRQPTTEAPARVARNGRGTPIMVALWEMDAGTTSLRITQAAPDASRLLGSGTSGSCSLRRWARRIHPRDRRWVVESLKQAAEAGSPRSFEYRVLRSRTDVVWLKCVAVPVRDGGPRRLRGMMLDVTAAKREEEQHRQLKVEVDALRMTLSHVESLARQQAQELVRRGTEVHELQAELAHVGRVAILAALTGPLAHELNQPLAAIMANAQAALRLLSLETPDLREVRAALDDIVTDDRLAADLIQRLRALIRKGEPEQGPVDLNTIVRDVARIVHYEVMDHGVTMDIRLCPQEALVHGDRVQLQQIVLNLTLNAIDAVRDVVDRPRSVALAAAVRGDVAEVTVTDTGVGASEMQITRMFEPFWTTKPSGTGLGLTICRSLAAAHGGELVAVRNPGAGMTFTLRLKAGASAKGT